MLKLFGHPDSGHSYKVKFLMTVANIPHDYETVDIFQPRDARPAQFRENSRYQEVPLLLDNGKPYVQSNAILIHLARSTGLWGAQDPDLFAHCTEWLFWEANKIGMCMPQLRVREKFADSSINEGAAQWLLARYTHDVNLMEQELADGRPWIIPGELPTIADFSLCGYLFFADEAKVSVPPAVQAWLDRLAALKGWQHPYALLAKPDDLAG